jgi:predicted O-methyltransferase YrrM
VSTEGALSRYFRPRAARARDAFKRGLARAARRVGLGYWVALEYPPSARSAGVTRTEGPLYEVVAGSEATYRETLRTIASLESDLARIPRAAHDGRTPSWDNEFMPGLDSASIYSFVRSRQPRTYFEIGSGISTRFARRAIEDGRLESRIVSIDPSPRAEIDALCDQVIRQPLELVEADRLPALEEGDVLFLDGSHRAFTGSDATVFFCDVLPTLPPGVLVGVHDIFLPDDYPEPFIERHYSEQYLLAALLVGRPEWIELVLASDYVSKRPELAGELSSLWARPELAGIATQGGGFWFELGARTHPR